MKRFMIAVALALVSMVSTAQNFRANLDESVKPGDDFWQYAVGSWLKNNPIDKEIVSTWTAWAVTRWVMNLSFPT